MPNNKYHNKRNSLYSNNHILMESIQNSYQNINGNENNFHINDLNKVDEKQEINCEKNNDINNKIEKPFVVEELRKREEINNKYKNIEKNEINTKNINNKNNNNKYHVKVILQKKDENKNNKHKISEDYKKHIIYYQKNDNISIVNSINNSSKKEKENNQKNELSNKYQKPYIRSASDPKFNQSIKSNYNERLNKNHNIKYDYKSNQQENKVNNYINSHNDNNKKIENQYKKELLDKNKSQYNFTNTPQGRYNSVNKYNNDNKLINQNPSINKDKENNIIYQNRNSKIKISTANKYIINNSSNNNLINRGKITDEKNPSLKRNSTYTKYIYNVEQTNIGVPTLKVTTNDKSVYYHSNVNPFSEGRMLAKYYAKPDTYNYNIFGFGFGWLFDAAMRPAMFGMILGQWLFKVIVALCDTPFFYLLTRGSTAQIAEDEE